jgi:hypothetical protein
MDVPSDKEINIAAEQFVFDGLDIGAMAGFVAHNKRLKEWIANQVNDEGLSRAQLVANALVLGLDLGVRVGENRFKVANAENPQPVETSEKST